MDAFNHQKQVEVLNDLIQINNDRIAGYKKAIGELQANENGDLVTLFLSMINDSNNYKTELEKIMRSFGGEPETGTIGTGKVYQLWMNFRIIFNGGDRKTILSSCEEAENAIQRAYKCALSEPRLTPDVFRLISSQKKALKDAHDEIKILRDALIIP